MKFEPGKWYRATRNVKVLCVGTGMDGRIVFDFSAGSGTLKADGDGRLSDGRQWILGEWKEPQVVEREVVLVRRLCGDLYAADAEHYYSDGRNIVAREVVSFTVEE